MTWIGVTLPFTFPLGRFRWVGSQSTAMIVHRIENITDKHIRRQAVWLCGKAFDSAEFEDCLRCLHLCWALPGEHRSVACEYCAISVALCHVEWRRWTVEKWGWDQKDIPQRRANRHQATLQHLWKNGDSRSAMQIVDIHPTSGHAFYFIFFLFFLVFVSFCFLCFVFFVSFCFVFFLF
jgi:hypothetical protein